MLFFLIFTRLLLAAPGPLAVSPGSPALVFDLPAVNVSAAMKVVSKPQVSLTDLSGILPSHPKKAVVLYFFRLQSSASAIASLNTLQQRYKNKGVQVLAICAGEGSIATISAALKKQNIRFPVLYDAHQVVSSRYGVSTFPVTVVVDSKGLVFAIGQPPVETLEAEIAAELDGLLSQ